MGDIYRRVRVCAIDKNGHRKKCHTVQALLDSGATVSVVSAHLASKLGAELVQKARDIDKKFYPIAPMELKLLASNCGPNRRPVVVDNDLAGKAAPRGQMILGTDYLQDRGVALLFSKRADLVSCPKPNGQRKR